jgi:hypothetical protein
MACSCHGITKNKVGGKVAADDQCTTCALKHIEMAAAAWGEFLYEEENRRWVAAHLRLAVEHLKIDHKATAVKVRNVAVAIELAQDKDKADIRSRIAEIHADALALFKADNPDYCGRLESLQKLDG